MYTIVQLFRYISGCQYITYRWRRR